MESKLQSIWAYPLRKITQATVFAELLRHRCPIIKPHLIKLQEEWVREHLKKHEDPAPEREENAIQVPASTPTKPDQRKRKNPMRSTFTQSVVDLPEKRNRRNRNLD